jgi:hypothetical protein
MHPFFKPPTNSFGLLSSGSAEVSASSIQTQKTINKCLGVAQKVAITAALALGVATVAGVAAFSFFVVSFAAVVSLSALYYATGFYNYKQICQTAGIIFKNAAEANKFEISGSKGKCEALPTDHCADTELWREELIKGAEHNILVSGNYCGGKSFAKFLDAVEARIKEKPNLKVVIISSPNFIQNGNLDKVKRFQKIYPQNFSLVDSPDIWHVTNGVKKSTNHTKCMVIDYGKYFILGGSGIKDNFAQTGLDDLTKEQFVAQRKGGAVQAASEEDPNKEDGFLGRMIPGNFRDMDFVFHSSGDVNPSGCQVYKQMLLLCHRWEQYNNMLNQPTVREQLDVSKLGVFTNKPTIPDAEDSVVVQLLKTPIPVWKKITTRVPAFDQSTKKSSDAWFQVFASGPEHDSSKFAAELKKKIERAQKRIVINHMYFQPTAEIMNALIAAAKRGIKIELITSGVYENCPNSHYVFGPRNKYNYAYLVNSLPESARENVKIYEYQQHKKGNHKKVVIIDDTVIAGSSNLGYKSLVTTSDHEINFFASSKQFAEETYKVCKVDIDRSKEVTGRITLTVGEYVKAALHRLMAPLIG